MKNKQFVKVKGNYPKKNSAYLASRGNPEVCSVSAPKEQSAFLASRGTPVKGKTSYKSRY